MMARVHSVSEVVYHRVNEIIGCQQEVKMRRDKHDMLDIISNYINREDQRITSGSRGEGFRMEGSDFDVMYWPPQRKVICNLSQVHLCNNTDDIILMEDHNTRPGFVLLKVLYQCTAIYFRDFLVYLHNTFYISSSAFRHISQLRCSLENSTIHGPCISNFIHEEIDHGHCFKSKHWPPQAYNWIERCKKSHWPPPSVLRNIIQSGCHFMAIGAKNSPNEILEWRLSFSQAEKKLVYCMSHCQFLVYGLLKLFLKEVLNKGIPDDNKLLCSYFIKTAIFWELQRNFLMQWNEQNFLSCFWSCFKCLMKWVYNEYCPNFFEPQNNMFYPKITGASQQRLFSQMFDLYQDGFHCLLRSSSIRDQLYSALFNIQHPIINVSALSELEHDCSLCSAARHNDFMHKNNQAVYMQTLIFLNTKLKSNISQTQRIIVHREIIEKSKRLAILVQNNLTHEANSEIYKQRKQSLKLMKLTTKSGWVSDILYLAMYHYNDGRYRHTLDLLHKAQYKLYRHYVMYNHACSIHYIQAVGGQPITTKMKEAWVTKIQIPVYTHFPELKLELRATQQRRNENLFLSPYVLLHFLYFLCYYKLDCAQQYQSLHDLHTLIVFDDGKYIDKRIKDIAWEILGVSYQLSGHTQHARECYLEAHRYSPENKIQQAALYRIQALERYM